MKKHKKYLFFNTDRRSVRKIRSYIFLIIFFVGWTGIAIAYSSSASAAAAPHQNDNTMMIWLLGLLLAAGKKIFIDSIEEIKTDIRIMNNEKQDKAVCKAVCNVKS